MWDRKQPQNRSKNLYKHNSYFIKSVYSIQKTPSLLPWAINSCRKCCGQSVHSSDQLPFQEKRPQGFRSRNSLMWGQRLTSSDEGNSHFDIYLSMQTPLTDDCNTLYVTAVSIHYKQHTVKCPHSNTEWVIHLLFGARLIPLICKRATSDRFRLKFIVFKNLVIWWDCEILQKRFTAGLNFISLVTVKKPLLCSLTMEAAMLKVIKLLRYAASLHPPKISSHKHLHTQICYSIRSMK